MTKPLNQVLTGAIASRRAAMRGMRGRTDWHDLRTAIAFAESFLRSYPVASDERVRQWCKANAQQVGRIVPANQHAVIAALMG